MLVTLLGIDIEVRPEQPKKALFPILATLLGIIVFLHPAIKVFVAVSIIALQLSRESYIELLSSTIIEVRPLQELNALLPMLITLLGMVTDVSLEQPENASYPMVVTLLGMVMEVRLKQLSNMPISMLLILPGRVIDESFEQP